MARHALTFRNPLPKGPHSADGYTLRWRGAALMGILNVTPDSFSDGGRYATLEAALRSAKGMLAAGALILDVGGESTRPGAQGVSVAEECDRVLPVLHRLREETDAILSIDSRQPEVAAAALGAGAHLVNDVGGLREPEMLALCAARGVPAVIMHMQGEPQTMQLEPHYDNVSEEVFGFLERQAERALAAGVPSVMLDPGIGFGKTATHNLQLVRDLNRLVALGQPVLLGASRKGTIGKLTGVERAAARDPGSVAFHLYGVDKGAAMVRVHNVAAHRQALDVWHALQGDTVHG